MGNVYGYCRVSSMSQNEDRQLVAMSEMGVPKHNVYTDKQSGKDFDRPMYKKLVRKIKSGDLLYVKSIDRLGRNYEEIIEQWKYLVKEKEIDICVLDMPLLDTRREKSLLGNFITDLVLSLLSYVSENERLSIRQRQAEGIAVAKAKGVHFGRKPSPLPGNFSEVYARWKNKEITVSQAAEECGMPQTTFYTRAKKYAEKREQVSQ